MSVFNRTSGMNPDQNLYEETFRANIEAGWQSGSRLREHVTVFPGLVGLEHHIPWIGTTNTTVRASGQPIVISETETSRPFLRLHPRESWGTVDKQDQALNNIALAAAKGMAHGKAVSRQYDGDIYSAMDEATTLATFTELAKTSYRRSSGPAEGRTEPHRIDKSDSIGDDGELDEAKIARAVTLLMDEEVGAENPEECILVAPALAFEKMVQREKFASMDFLQQGAGSSNVTSTAKFQSIYGCTPVFIPNGARIAGKGKPIANTAFLFAKSCIYLGIGITEDLAVMFWDDNRRSWVVGAESNADAVVANLGGIVRIDLTP